MYLKQNDTYITSDFNFLPIKDLQISDQVVILDKNNKMFTLAEKHDNNLFYLFSGYEANVSTSEEHYYENEDDEYKEPTVIKRAWMDEDRSEEEYLYIYDKMIKVNSGRNINLTRKEKVENSSLYDKIYNQLFKDDTYLLLNNKFSLDNTHYQYVCFEVDIDNTLVFLLSNFIDSEKRNWTYYKYCFIFNRSGYDYYIGNSNFKNLYEFALKQNEDKIRYSSIRRDKINEFEQLEKVMNNYVPISKKEIEEKSWNLYYQLRQYYSLDNIRLLFSPIYSSHLDSGDEFLVFISKFNTYSPEYNHVFKEKGISSYSLKYHDDILDDIKKDIEMEMRIGTAMFRYFFNNHNINPETGELNDSNNIIHSDFGGIIVKNNYSRDQHYIRLKNYFVPADTTEDAELIKDLISRKDLVKSLDEAL